MSGSGAPDKIMPACLPEVRCTPWSVAQRAASLAETLAAAPSINPIWVFAYGSLMWQPCFGFAEMRAAGLHGYRRSFCIWTVVSRGTPEKPGLGLALEEGAGKCDGIAYRLDADSLDNDLDAIWAREMYTGVYRPCWLPVETASESVIALTFVADRSHVQYAGERPVGEMAAIMAGACGENGRCRDYLAAMLDSLAAMGIDEAHFRDLLSRIDDHAEATTGQTSIGPSSS